MAKQLQFGTEARAGLQRGMEVLANAVVTTLLGRRAATLPWIRNGFPTITHDGVTVAKEIELSGPVREYGRATPQRSCDQDQ